MLSQIYLNKMKPVYNPLNMHTIRVVYPEQGPNILEMAGIRFSANKSKQFISNPYPFIEGTDKMPRNLN
jgi:hypothetical protein